MGSREAGGIKVYESDFLYDENGVMGHHVADFAAKRDGAAAHFDDFHAHFDDISGAGRTDEVDRGHRLGDDVGALEQSDCEDGSFFVDPFEKTTAEEAAIGVEILWLDPLSGQKFHVLAHRIRGY